MEVTKWSLLVFTLMKLNVQKILKANINKSGAYQHSEELLQSLGLQLEQEA